MKMLTHHIYVNMTITISKMTHDHKAIILDVLQYEAALNIQKKSNAFKFFLALF